MDTFRTKIRWSLSYSMRILRELLKDLWAYYLTSYPLLLIIGSIRRIGRRLQITWLAKPKGRPPIHENIIDLIIEMKRCNQNWGAQRISGIKRIGDAIQTCCLNPVVCEFLFQAIYQ